MDLINSILSCAGAYTDTERFTKERLVIDGITAGIRLFEQGRMTRDICMIDPDGDQPLLDELLLFSDAI